MSVLSGDMIDVFPAGVSIPECGAGEAFWRQSVDGAAATPSVDFGEVAAGRRCPNLVLPIVVLLLLAEVEHIE